MGMGQPQYSSASPAITIVLEIRQMFLTAFQISKRNDIILAHSSMVHKCNFLSRIGYFFTYNMVRNDNFSLDHFTWIL